ncbi:cobalamin biosynthesis protein CobD [Diaphorobacter sp. HDW4A]|uniref:adenosylcobinamide-phosphate synthase CbiB n=1 Tax=Diaphorobacter sp. HDW4A TaxID=2714924 RepID=UPI00140C3EAC|nr:adenosylcobinamide-phosphate synthase CbiB [Diaphorobacter sp. HDW4A]QIL79092.1 cobalamin biosynthesis protein CobD [Diaphorobacter sp. HDW4A]
MEADGILQTGGIFALALLIALVVDRWWGEPTARWHPVVWMGRALQRVGNATAPTEPTGRDMTSFWRAAVCWCVLALIGVAVAVLLQAAILCYAPWWLACVLLGLLIKPMLAWQMLHAEVTAVEDALARSLSEGQAQLGRLVSRDVQVLGEVQVRESAIESLAENLNDSVIAPIFWLVVAGLPGAVLYRFANTADAMWGYPGMRGGRYWQWAGKWAARADDVMSWIPARITAVALWCVTGCERWSALVANARKTPSPNSGWPMAAMALALGVRLSKPEVYVLNPEGRNAEPGDIARSAAIASRAVGCVVMLAVFCLVSMVVVRA